jgi:hypothetical protein
MEYWNDAQKIKCANPLFQGLFFISTLAIRESQGAKAEKESFELRVSSFRLIAPGTIFSEL